MNTLESPRKRRHHSTAAVRPFFNITPKLIVGILMLAVGIMVLVSGTNASHAADPSGTWLVSRFPHSLFYFTLSGVLTGLIGVWLLLGSLLTKRT